MSTQRISFNRAVKYVESYVYHLESVAKNIALGGTIRKIGIDGAIRLKAADPESFDIEHRGNMGWFCYNPDSNNSFPEFFLAFEESNEYEEGIEIEEPDKNHLTCPAKESIFRYEGINIPALLSTHSPRLGDVDQSISNAKVVQFKDNFKNHPVLQTGNNKKPYGFFENKVHKDIIKLIQDPDVHYIRYYFGYDKELKESKIRTILFGVDEDGRNIIPQTLTKAVEGEPSILQTSWPPKGVG